MTMTVGTSASSASSSSSSPKHFYVTCIYEYTPKENPDTKFRVGDVVRVVKVAPSGWICAELNNAFAWLPISYTRRRDKSKHKSQRASHRTTFRPVKTSPSTPSSTSSFEVRSRSSSGSSLLDTDQSFSDEEEDEGYEESASGSGCSSGRSLESIIEEPPCPKQAGLEGFLDWLLDLPLKSAEFDKKLHMLLVSFTTFTTANNLLDLLIVKYQMTMLLGNANKSTRRERIRKQKRVLNILALWMDKHRLIDDAPDTFAKLQDFLLSLCGSPTMTPSSRPTHQNTITQMHARLSSRIYGQYLHEGKRALATAIEGTEQCKQRRVDTLGLATPIDKSVLAQQLTLYEWRLYQKITPKACLRWHEKTRTDACAAITTFCGVSDKVSDWVKFTVLNEVDTFMRGDVIDHWIEIAELCSSWNNISSTLSIVAALSSTVLERLAKSWAFSKRQDRLANLQKLVAPNFNFRACREHLRNAEGPCVPFIGMNLTDLNHINDYYGDTTTPSQSPSTKLSPTDINFSKCQKSVDIVDIMLRHQSSSYLFEEEPTVMALVEDCLSNAARPQDWFWKRSEKLRTRHERSNSEPLVPINIKS